MSEEIAAKRGPGRPKKPIAEVSVTAKFKMKAKPNWEGVDPFLE